MTESDPSRDGESRRAFLKRSAAGVGAVGVAAAMGAAGRGTDGRRGDGQFTTTGTRQSTADRANRSTAGRTTGRPAGSRSVAVPVLVSTFEFFPGTTFRVTSRLDALTTTRLLSSPIGGTVPELSNPGDYTGYVVRFRRDGPRTVATGLAFTRRSLRVGGRYRLGENGTLFSSTLTLISTTASRVAGAERTTRRSTRTNRTRTTGGTAATTGGTAATTGETTVPDVKPEP